MEFLERHATKLAFAILLVDDFSNREPIGRVEVSLNGRKEKPVKNLSSYYIFLDLPDDTYTLQVRSDYYFDEDSEHITLAELDPKNPVVNITLKPNPSYPFPPGATLIRGKVYSGGEAVSGAKVWVKEKGVENTTTEKGEFVLYFRPLTEDEIIEVDGKRFVKGDGGKTLYLEAEGVTAPKELEAEEGKTTSVIIE